MAMTEKGSVSPSVTTRQMNRALAVVALSGAVVASLVAVLGWAGAPDVLTTHWGAGGADGWMPKVWAVAASLALAWGAVAWAVFYALRAPRSGSQLRDAALISMLFGWIGFGALASSFWWESSGAVVASVLAAVALTAGVGVLLRRAGSR